MGDKEESKPVIKSEDYNDDSATHITAVVVGPDGTKTSFKIKPSTKVKKLKQAYCQRAGIKPETVRLFLDGSRVNDEMTLKLLDVEDGQTFEVFKEQEGGC